MHTFNRKQSFARRFGGSNDSNRVLNPLNSFVGGLPTGLESFRMDIPGTME